MDLGTRMFVLEKALEIEKEISSLVLFFLNIETEKRKAITNKSGGLSFKNKIDLLFDIEVLSKTEYDELLLLMEYRNQFMHNYDCNTFIDANKLLGMDKENKLVKRLNSKKYVGDEINLIEGFYKDCYRQLTLDIIKFTQQKFENKISLNSENSRLIISPQMELLKVTTSYLELIDKVMVELIPKTSDTPELTNFKKELVSKFESISLEHFKNIDVEKVVRPLSGGRIIKILKGKK